MILSNKFFIKLEEKEAGGCTLSEFASLSFLPVLSLA